MKRFDSKHAGLEIRVFLQESLHGCSGNAACSRNGEMWPPSPFLDRQIAGERGFVNALVQLKQVRMRLANSDPKDLRLTSARKCSEAGDWQEKGAKTNGGQLFL